ncbi:MAG: hypothetical protein H6831_05940 [Planctomycetes bacterium]|nr:hypothetical protein [Planctomycetota bacterium]MCB9903932.1 hypothetical protein [Planctomycetota bacterium]
MSQLIRFGYSRATGAPHKRGSALVFSLIMVGIVTASGMMMLQLNIARSRERGQSTDNKRAIYIAEAGISEAYLAVAQGRSGNIGSEAAPARFANGVFWVEAVDGDKGQVALRSTGLCRTGRFALSVVVERTHDPIASLGMFGGAQVIVGEGAVVDGYDSRVGDPSAVRDLVDLISRGDKIPVPARLGSNGDALIEASANTRTMVVGDVTPGPGHAVTVEPNGVVAGSTLPGRTIVTLPELDAPQISSAGDLAIARGDLTVPSGEYRYGRMTIAAGQSLTIEGPCTLILDHLSLESGSELVADNHDGTVTLFIGESLHVSSGATITNGRRDPTQLVVLVGASDPVDVDGDGLLDAPFEFAPSGEFEGFLYAPFADFVVPSDLHLKGGVVAQSLTLDSGARLTFDAALEETDITLTGLPRLVAWRIVALPDVEIVNLREDPLRKLEQDGVTPTASGDAAKESYLRIVYLDTSGAKQDYEGFVSGLDWSQVRSVEKLRWFPEPGVDAGDWIKPTKIGKALVKQV